MAKRYAIVVILVMASQLLAAPFAAAQYGSGLPRLQEAPGFTQGPDLQPTGCASAPDITPPLPIAPLDHDVTVTANLQIIQNGGIKTAHLIKGSGDDARDAALMAHVEKNWRYHPLSKDCGGAMVRVVIHYLHITCAPQPLPETQTTPEEVDVQDQPRSTELQVSVAPDGRVTDASVKRSSGDAKLDAAAAAHVKEAWRWEPYVCKNAQGRPVEAVTGAATVSFDYAVSDPPQKPPR